jgi:hypothetical protein
MGFIRASSDITQGALKERGIDKMLEEARDDHKESDAIHMRRRCECWLIDFKFLLI